LESSSFRLLVFLSSYCCSPESTTLFQLQADRSCPKMLIPLQIAFLSLTAFLFKLLFICGSIFKLLVYLQTTDQHCAMRFHVPAHHDGNLFILQLLSQLFGGPSHATTLAQEHHSLLALHTHDLSLPVSPGTGFAEDNLLLY
jgi:hypothetical protein